MWNQRHCIVWTNALCEETNRCTGKNRFGYQRVNISDSVGQWVKHFTLLTFAKTMSCHDNQQKASARCLVSIVAQTSKWRRGVWEMAEPLRQRNRARLPPGKRGTIFLQGVQSPCNFLSFDPFHSWYLMHNILIPQKLYSAVSCIVKRWLLQIFADVTTAHLQNFIVI